MMSRMLIVLTVGLGVWQTPGRADDVVIDYTWKGEVNKAPIDATGKLTIAKDGKLKAEATFTQIPATFSPSVLDNSFLCFQCFISHEGDKGLQVLLNKKGDQVLSYRSFVIEDDAGKIIGAITVNGTLGRVGDNKYTTRAELNGQYSGPMEDITVGNYAFDLKAIGKGRLAGSYETSFEVKGRKYKLHVTTEYNYISGSVSAFPAGKSLSFAIRFDKSEFDGKQLKFSGTRTLTEK